MERVYDLGVEPSGDLYRRLLTYAATYCPKGLLVTRSIIGLSTRGEAFFRKLSPFLESVTQESEWLGTILTDHTASVTRFHFGPQVVSLVAAATDRLYGWIQPELPEDLCLLRSDGTPFLVTITHENDGYFKISEQEYEGLAGALPDLCLNRPS